MRGEVTSYEDEMQTLLELLSLYKYDCEEEFDRMTCLSERLTLSHVKREHASAFNG